MDVDETDGFGPIRTEYICSSTGTRLMQRLMQTCIGFLACGPYLQSSSGKAARDLELTQMILKSIEDPDKFKFSSDLCDKIFHSSVKTLRRCLRDFGNVLRQYSYSKQQSVIGSSGRHQRYISVFLTRRG